MIAAIQIICRKKFYIVLHSILSTKDLILIICNNLNTYLPDSFISYKYLECYIAYNTFWVHCDLNELLLVPLHR